jgi:NAD(P)-dependent dehydrogenase (short-subunit alcohol dehydrogenase family)
LTPLRRFILEAVPLEPTPRPALRLAPRAEIWVAGNESTLTTGIASRLTMVGFQARVLTPSEWPLREPSAQLAGLVVCAPETGTDDTFIKDAFRLLQRTAARLRASGQAGGALFATVSRLDGTFGIAHGTGDIVSGALAGLAKTAAHEWPEVACKAIDLQADASESDDAVLASVDELLKVGPVEVGWSQAGRSTLQVTERAVDGALAEMPFRQGEVVVVSGGARGVTAEVAVAVARASRATLLLLGRSPQPTPEPDWLTGLTDEGDIKRELLAHGGPAAPKDLGEQYRRALANREVLHNLRRIEQAGGKALYRQVDVRDAVAVATVLAEVRAKNGPIVGLVHGAGVLADRRIEDKTAEQFASVWDTKVGGLRALLAATATDALRAVALFSSSTGRFGRSGQVDYAAANELLNKVAQAEARQRSGCRVVSLNWGPWDGGMVTPGLKKVFAGEGVGVIPLAEGAEFFVRELRTTGPVEVVVLAGDVPGLSAPAPASTLPIALEREVSAELLPVLQSHVIAGRAVLPMALSVEWMGHAALHANPGLVFLGCDDLRVLKGLRLAEGERCLVRARAGKAVKDDTAFRVPVELRSVGASGKETLHVAATVLLANKLPTPEATPSLPALRPYGRTVQAAYEQVLFHGPALRGITRVDGCSEQGIAAVVAAAPVPSEWLKQPLRGSWLADPLALDAAFQMMILWSQEVHGAPSLPCGAGQYRQYVRAFPREGTKIVARITRAVGQRISADLWFLDGRGAVVARMSDYECVIDPALAASFRRNRLTPEALPSS